MGVFWKVIRRSLTKHYGIEIPYDVTLGYGVLLNHPRDITINYQAVIGDNLTILKGATIGSQLRGSKCGAPVIGNDVYVGLNATIVGKVKIGNNVLIAPNAYVNFDVPDNSIVIGNPGKIHFSEDAVKCYIKNRYSTEQQ